MPAVQRCPRCINICQLLDALELDLRRLLEYQIAVLQISLGFFCLVQRIAHFFVKETKLDPDLRKLAKSALWVDGLNRSGKGMRTLSGVFNELEPVQPLLHVAGILR